jgi:hypothetical protein
MLSAGASMVIRETPPTMTVRGDESESEQPRVVHASLDARDPANFNEPCILKVLSSMNFYSANEWRVVTSSTSCPTEEVDEVAVGISEVN